MSNGFSLPMAVSIALLHKRQCPGFAGRVPLVFPSRKAQRAAYTHKERKNNFTRDLYRYVGTAPKLL